MKRTSSTWLDRLNPAKSKVAAITTAVGLAAALPGCLERPLGQDGPRTTNIIVDLLPQNVVDKVDMLFVIDNSMSMADKQAILAEAVPDLVSRFVKPVCLNAQNEEAAANANGDCPQGFGPEFTPINDIHIGVVTSSLGGFGSQNDCVPDGAHPYFVQKYDMGRLIGSLSEPAEVPAPSAVRRTNNVAAGGDFLTWNGGGQAELQTLSDNFANQVKGAGEQGCGWEATMEAWVHFLVDPAPFTSIVRQKCKPTDTTENCAGPAKDANDVPLVDNVILEQRERFMRMDSLLAVIMLTDENDCSFRVGVQQVLLSDTATPEGRQTTTYKGSAACATDPNSACCHTCGANPPSGCDGAGCEEPYYPEPDATQGKFFEDQINLRCYKQKQRFGLDFLYPVERYSNALSLDTICPSNLDLSPENCPGTPVDNPVFTRTVGGTTETRPKSLVFFAGILGVPWQDLALDPTGNTNLRYKKAKDDTNPTIDWDILLGKQIKTDLPPGKLKRQLYPTLENGIDPLMFESVQARSGVNPATQEPLAPPTAGFMANSINGHEWNPLEGSDLQYACIFKLAQPTECPTYEQSIANEKAQMARQPNCDCSLYGNTDDLEYNTPLCQSQQGYGMTQTYAKAYPGIRELQALELFSEVNPTKNSIVASICPKEPDDAGKPDFGYRPAVATIVDRLKEQLQEPCLPRPLSMRDDGSAACIIVEANQNPEACNGEFREPVDAPIADAVMNALKSGKHCTGDKCKSYNFCEIPQIDQGSPSYDACITGNGGDGWCYVDWDQIEKDTGNEPTGAVREDLLKCPETARRKLKFAGEGKVNTTGSLTFFACSGSVYDVE